MYLPGNLSGRLKQNVRLLQINVQTDTDPEQIKNLIHDYSNGELCIYPVELVAGSDQNGKYYRYLWGNTHSGIRDYSVDDRFVMV